MSDFTHAKYDYQAVQGDRQPISETLEGPDGTSPDLTDRSVTAIVRHVVSDTKVVDAAATIDDAAAGSVSYTLSTAETGREGLHHVEFEVTGGDTDPTTFPVAEPLALNVRASVEGGDGVAELEEDGTVDTLEANAIGTAADPVDEAYHEVTDTEELSANSTPASYHVHTDGTTIFALPQRRGLSQVEGTDIQTVLETVVIDEMPPAGNAAEAFGRIYFKAHSETYPGTLSNFAGIVSGVAYVGETVTHSLPSMSSGGPQRPSQPGVAFETDGVAFEAPASADIDSDDEPINFNYFENLSIIGAGSGVGAAFDFEVGSDSYGHTYIDNVIIQEVLDPIRTGTTGSDTPMTYNDMHVLGFDGQLDVRRNAVMSKSRIVVGSGGGQVLVNDGDLTASTVHGQGESRAMVRLEDGARANDVNFKKTGGTDGSGQAVKMTGSSHAGGLNFTGAGSKAFGSKIVTRGNNTVAGPVKDGQTNGTTIVLNANATDPDLRLSSVPSQGVFDGGATRPRWNGVIGGGPFEGVDLSSTTGQYVGDRAIADGTSAANAGDRARWNGSSWDVFQPATTV